MPDLQNWDQVRDENCRMVVPRNRPIYNAYTPCLSTWNWSTLKNCGTNRRMCTNIQSQLFVQKVWVAGPSHFLVSGVLGLSRQKSCWLPESTHHLEYERTSSPNKLFSYSFVLRFNWLSAPNEWKMFFFLGLFLLRLVGSRLPHAWEKSTWCLQLGKFLVIEISRKHDMTSFSVFKALELFQGEALWIDWKKKCRRLRFKIIPVQKEVVPFSLTDSDSCRFWFSLELIFSSAGDSDLGEMLWNPRYNPALCRLEILSEPVAFQTALSVQYSPGEMESTLNRHQKHCCSVFEWRAPHLRTEWTAVRGCQPGAEHTWLIEPTTRL